MATHHAAAGEPVDLATWGDELPVEHSKAIAKIDGLELARLVVEAGEGTRHDDQHHVRGPIVIHCIDGEVAVELPGTLATLKSGQLLYLEGGTEHALRGIVKSVVLLTIVLV